MWWKEERGGRQEASPRISVLPLTFFGIIVKNLFFPLWGRTCNTCLTSHSACVRIKGDAICKCFINRRSWTRSSQSVNDTWVLTRFSLSSSRPLHSESAEIQVAVLIRSNSAPWLLDVLKHLPNKDTQVGWVQWGTILCQWVWKELCKRKSISTGFLPIKSTYYV